MRTSQVCVTSSMVGVIYIFLWGFMSCAYKLECRLLKFSTFSCFCFAAVGIGFGILAGSLVIVFDGAYSLISLFLSVLSLAAASYIHQDPVKSMRKKDRHVSKYKAAMIESSVVLLKGIIIALVCVFSFLSALSAMFDGGKEVDTGFALVFGVINLAGCLVSYAVIKQNLSRSPSALLKAEASQWLMDTVISGAVLIGFLLATFLVRLGFETLAVYADPFMVILASGYFVTVPSKMIAQSSRQLLALQKQYKVACQTKTANALFAVNRNAV